MEFDQVTTFKTFMFYYFCNSECTLALIPLSSYIHFLECYKKGL